MADLSTSRTTSSTAQEHLDDHAELHTRHNLIDAKGDIIVGSGVNTAGRLAVGSTGQVLTVQADGSLAWVTPSSSSSAITWTKLVDNNPMTSLTGFTSRSGTWSLGGFGVDQSATIQDSFLECNTDLSTYDLRAIQATIRLPNTGNIVVGVGFSDSGSWSNNDLSIGLRESDDTVWWDKFGVGGSTSAAGFAVVFSTDYVLKVVEHTRSTKYLVYVNDSYVTAVTTSGINFNRVGLYTRGGAGQFRNVSVWGGTPAFNPPS